MSADQQLSAAVAGVVDPELGRTLGELKMVKEVSVAGDEAKVRIELPTPAYPSPERIEQAVRQATAAVRGGSKLDVEFSAVVKGKMSGGGLGLRAKNIIAVGSGKGGVGKSTIAASIAYGLQSLGCEVGLMDADVYGPSIPHLVGANEQPVALTHTLADGSTVQRIQPVMAEGLKTISMGFFVKQDQAVIWRGPLLHRAITQFLQDVDWGDLDYLIIDMPPGTGDVSLTLSQLVGLAGAVVVCTPQQVALLDAMKAISMYRQVKIPVLGMVENMTGDIFGRGGALAKANEMGIPVLGELPINPQVRILGDEGKIAHLYNEDSPSREYLISICQRVAVEVARNVLEGPALPTLEVI